MSLTRPYYESNHLVDIRVALLNPIPLLLLKCWVSAILTPAFILKSQVISDMAAFLIKRKPYVSAIFTLT